jgi:energy-coupling factor transport system ATP-binding protein
MGLLAHRGEIEVDGRAIHSLPVAGRARAVAYLPQSPSAFLFAETVREELLTTLRYHGLPPVAEYLPDPMLEAFSLTPLADRYPRDLSAGERQRTALAAVMIARPGVVLLDEPTLGMDPLSQSDLARRIRGWKRGLAVVVATHDVEFCRRSPTGRSCCRPGKGWQTGGRERCSSDGRACRRPCSSSPGGHGRRVSMI